MSGLATATLVPGVAEGDVLVLAEPVSFWGGYDTATGRIIDRRHPDRGVSCSGRVLVMTASRGSSSGSSVLAEAIRARTAPAAIILAERDAILTVGAMVAAELYGLDCPIVVAAPADWPAILAMSRARVEAGADGAVVSAMAP
jgi:predicted aconitase with swiveling domain